MRRCVGIILFVFCLLFGSCRQHDFRTVEISVPGMKNRACSEIVGRRLAGVPGVDVSSIRIDLQRRAVTVRYDSLKLSLKNIEFAVAEVGFNANEVPARAEAAAALPPGCR